MAPAAALGDSFRSFFESVDKFFSNLADVNVGTLLLALLFFTGYRWAKYTLGHPWIVGSCFLIGGIAMVWTAIMLGG